MPRGFPDKQQFYKPEAGRITTLEDRTKLPFAYWSPLDSATYAIHQTRLIHRNAHTIVRYLKGFDWLGLGLVSAIVGYLLGAPWKKILQEEPWRLAFIPIASLAVIYLPVYAGADYSIDVRYYWVAVPFLIAASFGFALHMSGAKFKHGAVQRGLALTLVTLSLMIGNEDVLPPGILFVSICEHRLPRSLDTGQ